jgi:hypothetical protein
MAMQTKPCSCGGKFKKRTTKPANPRDGSRYYQCAKCWKLLELTAENYELFDEGKPPEKKVEAPAAIPPLRRPLW